VVAVQPDGKIIMGGDFSSYNGDAVASDYVMRLNADGTRDTLFNAAGMGANNIVYAVAVQPDGKIVIGGEFTSYNDTVVSARLIRLNADGTRDATFNAGGSGANGVVFAVAVQPDGKIVIGGDFIRYNGDAAASDRVMRVNADGTADTTFNAGGTGANDFVRAVVVQPDGRIVIGGFFTLYDGAASGKVTRLVKVSPNHAPSFTKGLDQTVNEDAGPQSVPNWATAISPGPTYESGQTVSFQILGNTASGLFATAPAISSTGTLTYTTAANTVGTATITINLKDDGGTANGGFDTSASTSFTITVNAVNDAPSFTKGANQTVNEDSVLQTVNNWATNISPGPGETGQTVTFTATNDNNALFSTQPAINAAGDLTYRPANNANGTAAVSVTLKDNVVPQMAVSTRRRLKHLR
jgi:uncharacterized delta-60 repeat protein